MTLAPGAIDHDAPGWLLVSAYPKKAPDPVRPRPPQRSPKMHKTFWKQHKPKKQAKGTTRRTIDAMDHNELVRILDREFSTLLRTRAVLTANGPIIQCCTCGKPDHWKSMDCGHYIGRAYMGTRWDFRNVAVQCPSCNRFNEGQKHLMAKYLAAQGSDLDAVQKLAEFWGRAHHAREELITWINQTREMNAKVRAKLQEQGWE